MPLIICPTCGVATDVNDRGEPATCPECQDWLPVEKLPDALPVRRQRRFPWPAVYIPVALVAGVAILVGVLMLSAPRKVPPAAPPPVPTVANPPAPTYPRFQAADFLPLSAAHNLDVVELEGEASVSRSNRDNSAGLQFASGPHTLIVCELQRSEVDRLPSLVPDGATRHVVIRGECHSDIPDGVVFLTGGLILSAR